jgi:hypothetical protein
MIVTRNVSHEALHKVGALRVEQLSPGVFDVSPNIDLSLLDAAVSDIAAAALAASKKAAAAKRIAEIRLDLIDKIADKLMSTPAEQGVANAAIASLRDELALEKTKR